MNKRPVLITIISIILIVLSAITAFSHTLRILYDMELKTIIFPSSKIIKIIIMYLSSLVLLLSGVVTIKGKSLGRTLIIIWCLFTLVIYADFILPRIVYIVTLSIVLFNKSANNYFNKENRNNLTI
ncbi:phosphoglycerol transferase MdoB-like AlkP superfamily enzyme [Paenibacillus castaneae]|nr:phosphoglycerol transferase MdoB-like AlkP superfamily enzyme [Paenibacillus castaneae]